MINMAEKEKLPKQIIEELWHTPLKKYDPLVKMPPFPKGNLQDQLFVTSKPDEVFGTGRGFHVTSDYILPLLADGLPILPPFLHKDAGVITHRKSSLPLGDAFLELFGIDLSTKKAFIFGSPKIDAQQVVIEDHIAKNIGTSFGGLDEFGKILFERVDYDHGFPKFIDPIIKYEWIEIFENLSLYEGLPSQYLEENRPFIEHALKTTNVYAGFRDGWFKKIWNILQGNERIKTDLSYDNMAYSEYLLDKLLPAFDSWIETFRNSNQSVMPGNAIVLEYDTQKTYKRLQNNPNGIVPVLLGSRHPKHIHHFPHLTPADITAIYITGDTNQTHAASELQSDGIVIDKIENLPNECFIAGIKPDQIIIDDIDPLNPLCEIRYEENPKKEFKNWQKNGVVRKVSLN